MGKARLKIARLKIATSNLAAQAFRTAQAFIPNRFRPISNVKLSPFYSKYIHYATQEEGPKG
jgi:hypothetical protein